MESRRFSPELESVTAIQKFVKERAVPHAEDSGKLYKIDLVIEELIVNIVKHGLSNVVDGCIEVCTKLTDEGLFLGIMDNGPEFDPVKRKDPDTTTEIVNRNPGGLGIFFVKQFSKKIHYERRENKNFIRLWLEI